MSYEEKARNDGFGAGYSRFYGHDAIVVGNEKIPVDLIPPKIDFGANVVSRAIRHTLDTVYGGNDPNTIIETHKVIDKNTEVWTYN
ncbi:MAG: hypothetical protein U9O53_00275 [archaeon]|nr:hypothetical protein [archaeon]